jgi:phospholipid/cholesterol/gamma-HCH transport system substrate-binding protein
METKASYVVVGAFALALIVGVFGFVVWLGRFEVSRALAYYYIYFPGSVTGLQDGSQVRYRGIPVGRIIDLRIDPDNVEQVQAMLEIPRDVPVKTDTLASIELQGITGVAYVQLTGGTQAAATLEPPPGKRYARIPARASRLEQVFEKAPELVATLTTLMMQASDVLRDENRQAVADTLANLAKVSGAVANRSAELDRLIVDSSQMARDLSSAARTLDRQVGGIAEEMASTFGVVRGTMAGLDEQAAQIGREVTRSLQQLVRTADSFSKAADSIGAIAGDNRDAFKEFANTGLYQFTQFVTEVRELIAGLVRVSAEIERDPRRFLLGDQTRGVEAR